PKGHPTFCARALAAQLPAIALSKHGIRPLCVLSRRLLVGRWYCLGSLSRLWFRLLFEDVVLPSAVSVRFPGWRPSRHTTLAPVSPTPNAECCLVAVAQSGLQHRLWKAGLAPAQVRRHALR